jgi:ABC-type dipeptide/oligopeptide/nickel transport system permease component|tara:strand:- start:1033 stop:1965 length:933 start_codon:yes stop_codon:yes gene_type:complete
MINHTTKRILEVIPVLLIVSVIVFSMMHLLPGDPTLLMLAGAEGGSIPQERLNELREIMGLNKPLYEQYINFITNALSGDLGTSIRLRTPVTEVLLQKIPYTLMLSLLGLIFSLILGVFIGLIAALFKDTWIDHFSMTLSLIGVSMPIYWLGLLLILFFSINLNIFPSSGATGWESIVLPALTLGFVSAGLISRLLRSSLLEVLNEDYIRTAKGKGLTNTIILIKHALKNAMIPVITILGLQFGNMLAGAVVTETVFSRPGLGRLVVNGILWKDYPLVQGTVLFIACIYVFVNLFVDISYSWFDPRIKLK